MRHRHFGEDEGEWYKRVWCQFHFKEKRLEELEL
jgi:hypothetical protein